MPETNNLKDPEANQRDQFTSMAEDLSSELPRTEPPNCKSNALTTRPRCLLLCCLVELAFKGGPLFFVGGLRMKGDREKKGSGKKKEEKAQFRLFC